LKNRLLILIITTLCLIVVYSCSKEDSSPGHGPSVSKPTESLQYYLDQGEIQGLINNWPIDSFYGKNYLGGIIYHIEFAGPNTNWVVGSIVTPFDVDTSTVWWNGLNLNTGAIGSVYGTGETNTASIVVSQGLGNYAAQNCNDLNYNNTNWYLPSSGELQEVYQNLHLNGYGNFANDSYWSSTEMDSSLAITINFNNGSFVNTLKSAPNNVRAVGSF